MRAAHNVSLQTMYVIIYVESFLAIPFSKSCLKNKFTVWYNSLASIFVKMNIVIVFERERERERGWSVMRSAFNGKNTDLSKLNPQNTFAPPGWLSSQRVRLVT